MQNAVQVFENKEFGQIRTVEIDGQPWFVGKDVTSILGYTNASEAMKYHVDEDDKLNSKMLSSLGQRGGWIINESGLYSLILSSKLPTAKAFKRWVTSEVLPTIRKHGAYINDDVLHNMQEDSDYSAELLRNLTAERNRSNALINKMAQLAPKAHYHDIILQCPDAIPVTFIAKDYGMSGAAFNKLLYKLNVQFRIGRTWLLYAKYQRNGYTVTNTYTKNGMTTLVHTCWTQRGRFWLYELLKSNGILPAIEQMANNEQPPFGKTGAFAGS
jgi:prophage antirepressor-like protein